MYFAVDGCLDIALNFNLRLNWADGPADILIVSEKREHLRVAFNSLIFHSLFLVVIIFSYGMFKRLLRFQPSLMEHNAIISSNSFVLLQPSVCAGLSLAPTSEDSCVVT